MTNKVRICVTVSRLRAEYLARCLVRKLCGYCGREADECKADPCTDRRVDQGELAYCSGCWQLFDPAAINDGLCSKCERIEEAAEARYALSGRGKPVLIDD